MTNWFEAGRRVESLPLDDRGLQYGDGVFETVAIRDGTPRFLALHLERLQSGCDRLGLPAAAAADVTNQLSAALAECDIDTDFAVAKIIVTAGSGPRGYRRAEPVAVALRIGLFSATPLDANHYREGVAAGICATRLAVQPQLAGIKALCRLEQVLATAEPADSAHFERLMLDTEDRLICGTMSNVFIVTGKQVSTPAITRCGVSGVMRRHLLTLLEREAIACDVVDLGADVLHSADEAFLSNSQFGVVPVREIDGRPLAIGDATRTIMTLAAASGVPECCP